MDINDIKNVESEAGIVSSIILKPDLTFYSETLRPNHFTDKNNAFMYYAICELAKRGVEKIDSYNITNMLNMKESTRKATEFLTITTIDEMIRMASLIARSTVEEYLILVGNVMNAAFRRDTYSKLKECEQMCLSNPDDDIAHRIYDTIDGVVMQFSTMTDLPEYKDEVDRLWGEIVDRQGNGMSGIPFPFATLNQYATIEPGELVVFAAEAKQGKSMFLLCCAVHLLKLGYSVLYIDSELNSKLFTCRLISHLTKIEFSRVKSGNYTQEESEKISAAVEWIKTTRFIHKYLPEFNPESIYTAARKAKHSIDISVIIIDYFKSGSDGDAFATYAELGRLTDCVKNTICGDMNIAGIGAAQLTSSGKIADSAKIARNASTIAMIQDKTPEEIDADGAECGNKKLRVVLNRNGAQHLANEYIDLMFQGNIISYTEAKQHDPFSGAPF